MLKAIVVGVERYALISSRMGGVVPGAVADALAFRDWLRTEQGMRDDEIALHLAPAGGGADNDAATLAASGAGRAEIVQSVRRLRTDGEGQLERTFFYFVGHGFQFGTDLFAQPELALVASGFTDVESGMDETLRFSELRAVLDGLGAGFRYFFVDCCQNVLSLQELSGGALGINMQRARNARAPSGRYVLYSTQPGRSAAAPPAGLAGAAGPRSAFSLALLDGLKGAGTAKDWDTESEDERLVVTFASLAAYVAERLRDEEAQVAPPESYGPGRDILRVFAPPPAVRCRVTVTGAPPTAALSATLATQGLNRRFALSNGKGEELVPPNRYFVAIEGAPGPFEPPRQRVVLFDDMEVPFSYRPPSGGLFTGGFAFHELPVGKGTLRSIRPDLDSLFPELGAKAVASPSPFDPVAVRYELFPGSYRASIEDERGRKVADLDPGSFAPQQGRLTPDIYRAVVEEAGRVSFRQPFEVLPREPLRLELTPPGPSDRHGPARALFDRLEPVNGWLQLAKGLGGVADASLEMLLALLATQSAWPAANKLAQIPLPRFWNVGPNASALLVLVGCDGDVDVHGWRTSGEDLRLEAARPLPEAPGLVAAATGPLCAGTVIVEWRTAKQHRAMPVELLANRLTCLLVTSRQGVRDAPYVLLLPLRHLATALPADERPVALDAGSPFDATRWILNAQRASEQGQPFDVARAGFVDPLLDMLDAYGALARGERDVAARAVARLRDRHPGLPDTRALARAIGAEGGHDAGAAAEGIPMFAHGAAIHIVGDVPAVLPPGARSTLVGFWTGWELQ